MARALHGVTKSLAREPYGETRPLEVPLKYTILGKSGRQVPQSDTQSVVLNSNTPTQATFDVTVAIRIWYLHRLRSWVWWDGNPTDSKNNLIAVPPSTQMSVKRT